MIFNVKEEDCRKIGVYSITNNINNKLYVGSTTTNFKHRYLQYKIDYSKIEFYGYGQDKCFVFINFMKNYGSL